MAKQILSLSTTDFDRPIIEIDGENYEMRSHEELSVDMVRQLDGHGESIISSVRPENDGPRDYDALELSTRESVKLVMVDLPDEVLDKLPLGMQQQIVSTFSGLARNAKRAGEEATATD